MIQEKLIYILEFTILPIAIGLLLAWGGWILWGWEGWYWKFLSGVVLMISVLFVLFPIAWTLFPDAGDLR